MLQCCVCADSNLNSTTVGRGQVDSSLPRKFKLFRFRELGSRAERDAVRIVTEGQLKQMCLLSWFILIIHAYISIC